MKKIGKFEICGLLGRGGMGKVYKVRVPVIGKIAALKLLEPNPFLIDLIGMKAIYDLFLSEAVMMAKLKHPNLADILYFDEADGKPFYLMEYFCNNLGVMIGESYDMEKSSRMISVDKAIHYTKQTLEGLACLHHAGIVHRDIKPYNILITTEDSVKICDFGLSRLTGESRFLENSEHPKGLKVGSPWYAAPEQEENPDRADFTADIYSVGVMLYRMLTGYFPEKRQKLARYNPDLNHHWDEFIDHAIIADPRDRFQSAKVMLKELEKLESDWNSRKEKLCRTPLFEPSEQLACKVFPNLRTQAVKANSASVFPTDDLRLAKCYRHELKDNGDETISDKATGLIWEKSGSDYPMDWHQAREYIRSLNIRRFAGYDNWRLPTVDELLSLITKPSHGEDICIEPIFDRKQKWLWSIDRRSYTSAWYVSLDMGFVAWHDFSGSYYVRGVR